MTELVRGGGSAKLPPHLPRDQGAIRPFVCWAPSAQSGGPGLTAGSRHDRVWSALGQSWGCPWREQGVPTEWDGAEGPVKRRWLSEGAS